MKRALSVNEERIPESNPVFQNISNQKIIQSRHLESSDILDTTLKVLPTLPERRRSVVFKELREVYTPDDYDFKMVQLKKDRERSKSTSNRIRRMSSEVVEHLIDYFNHVKK
ncbi:hypothetical protein HDV06_003329 [Boothiomyces sp. JEL0866]|nr:hypothetical protein HDV06_003329 [Boothiomyces sp. JEL0866]